MGIVTSDPAGSVVLYEFLAWLQEQEQFWNAEEPLDETIEPALPSGVAQSDIDLNAPEPNEAEPSSTNTDQVRAKAWSSGS